MEANSYLVSINHALLVRDEEVIQKSCLAIQKHLEEGGSEPSWGWNGFITRAQFTTLSSICPRCREKWRLASKGLFGYDCVCSGCYDPGVEQCNIMGKGETMEDSVKSWFDLVSARL
jgi:hypothetical protein